MGKGWLQVWFYMYKGAIIADMSADPVSLSDMPACTVQQTWGELLRIVMVELALLTKMCIELALALLDFEKVMH